MLSRASRSSPAVTRDVAFELLSCRRRRHVLHCMKRRERTSLRTLAEQIAAWENGVEPGAVTYEQRMRVHTTLRQIHLPKLDEGGIVRWDPDRGTVEVTESARELDVYLDVVPHNDIPWGTFYLGLGVLAFWLVTVVWLAVPPFSVLSPIGVSLLVAAGLTVSGLLHWRHDRRYRLGGEGQTPPEVQ